MANDSNQKSAIFIEWFSKAPSVSQSKKIKLADLGDAGRGVGAPVATADIKEDEELFSLPRNLVISVETSELPSILPHIFDDLDPWLSLILVLIYEHLKGANSAWAPYLAVLPEKFDTLMFWSDDDLDELQASAVRGKMGREEADKTFREKLVPLIRSNSDILLAHVGALLSPALLSDDEIIALAHRTGSAVMAYAFDIEKDELQREEDEEGYASEEEDEALPKGMVPLADMLNADANQQSLKPIKAGEEILNDYGPLPRADMLRRYGYITQNYAQYDVAEVPQTLIIQEVRRHPQWAEHVAKRISYLEAREALEDSFDIINPSESGSAFTSELLITLNTLLLSGSDFEKFKSKETLPKPKMTRDVAKVLERVLVSKHAQYATTIEEDEATLLENGLPHRKRMAVEVRLGEKMILAMAQAELSDALKKPQSDRESSTKRGYPNGEANGNHKKHKRA